MGWLAASAGARPSPNAHLRFLTSTILCLGSRIISSFYVATQHMFDGCLDLHLAVAAVNIAWFFATDRAASATTAAATVTAAADKPTAAKASEFPVQLPTIQLNSTEQIGMNCSCCYAPAAVGPMRWKRHARCRCIRVRHRLHTGVSLGATGLFKPISCPLCPFLWHSNVVQKDGSIGSGFD